MAVPLSDLASMEYCHLLLFFDWNIWSSCLTTLLLWNIVLWCYSPLEVWRTILLIFVLSALLDLFADSTTVNLALFWIGSPA
jgi:hypothetical protein